jgi:hypothetical protein
MALFSFCLLLIEQGFAKKGELGVFALPGCAFWCSRAIVRLVLFFVSRCFCSDWLTCPLCFVRLGFVGLVALTFCHPLNSFEQFWFLSCLQIVFFAVFLLTFLVGKLGG